MDNSDASAIFRTDVPEDLETSRLIESENEEAPLDVMEMQKAPNAIPMLDDATLARARLMQIMVGRRGSQVFFLNMSRYKSSSLNSFPLFDRPVG
ncbi:hypothetical protein EVAR_70029_1 [Eumeta japonica]|uniref:Uncharacterized protein n=1 Tax=Eumeta variegata TaxID=151549 RepID=A0A4C2A4X0_EUMVA|nr:hypothetical protein EVAR_70029_1 [Eumeta japonica]